MGILDELRTENPVVQSTQPPPPQGGLVWVMMLIKYDLKGTAQVIQSFTRPAKDSVIKKFHSGKKKVQKQSIKIDESSDKAALF